MMEASQPTLLDPSIEHYQRAAAGSLESFAALRDIALSGEKLGMMTYTESLTAAERYAYLAASGGGRDERRQLATILLARAEDRAARGEPADFFRREAAHYLKLLADEGDAEASETLKSLGCGDVWVVEPETERLRQSVERSYAEAARGDPSVLAAMIRGILSEKGPGPYSLEDLVAVEHLARLGAFMGDVVLKAFLVDALLFRAQYEAGEGGCQERCVTAWMEAFETGADLVASGHTELSPLLVDLANSLLPAQLAVLGEELPVLIAYRTVEGVA